MKYKKTTYHIEENLISSLQKDMALVCLVRVAVDVLIHIVIFIFCWIFHSATLVKVFM